MSDPLMPHLTPDEVELWAQGLLPATRDAHVAQLTRFAPEFGFVERVMAKVKIPARSGPHFRPHTDA